MKNMMTGAGDRAVRYYVLTQACALTGSTHFHGSTTKTTGHVNVDPYAVGPSQSGDPLFMYRQKPSAHSASCTSPATMPASRCGTRLTDVPH
jgi:hypothetical protein